MTIEDLLGDRNRRGSPSSLRRDSDELEFEERVRPLLGALLAYFERRVLPREDAADCLNDTLIVLWRKQHRLPSDQDASRAWAFGVARNVLANHRRASIRRSALVDRLRTELESPAAGNTTADQERVAAALAHLPEKDRELLRLIAWDGFGVAEAGLILGLKPAASRARFARAKHKLAIHLQ